MERKLGLKCKSSIVKSDVCADASLQTEKPTLWFYDVQQRLGARAGRCSQRPDAALGCIHHSFQQRQAVFGAGVGPGHGLTG